VVQSVQYVKICSLYGVGFYYVPGTDMCIKIGGWVRAEYAYGDNGNFAWGWANNNANNRNTNNSTWRARGYITADARNQTEYGTVRGYLAVGLSTNNIGADNAGNTFSSNRAFIQWAGFTFGLTQSFFDFYNSPATSYWGSFPASDTSDGGSPSQYDLLRGQYRQSQHRPRKRRDLPHVGDHGAGGRLRGGLHRGRGVRDGLLRAAYGWRSVFGRAFLTGGTGRSMRT